MSVRTITETECRVITVLVHTFTVQNMFTAQTALTSADKYIFYTAIMTNVIIYSFVSDSIDIYPIINFSLFIFPPLNIIILWIILVIIYTNKMYMFMITHYI